MPKARSPASGIGPASGTNVVVQKKPEAPDSARATSALDVPGLT